MSPEAYLETLHAQEVLCLARRRFGVTHRALWHLAHLRCGVSASSGKNREGGDSECVKILHVEPLAGAAAVQNLHCWEAQITTRTQVFFVSTRYHIVFSLDMSPSLSVIDSSFKGMSTGSFLFDSLQPCLEDTLHALLAEMRIAGERFQPEIYVTIVAQAPCFNMQVLARSFFLTTESLPELLLLVHTRFLKLGERSAEWLQGDHGPQQKRGVCEDVSFMLLRNCLLALQLSEVSNATPAIVLLTDGVMCNLFRTMNFQNSLMHLNSLDVALHIVQIGGGFAPWSALGMCSDLDLLHFVVSSTPGGVIFQDHHISSMLRQHASGGATSVNRVQRAWLWRGSPLSISQEHRSRLYSDRSFISSVMDPNEEGDEQDYKDHLQRLGCKVMPQIVLEGLDDTISPMVATAFPAVASIPLRSSTESSTTLSSMANSFSSPNMRQYSGGLRQHGSSPLMSPIMSSASMRQYSGGLRQHGSSPLMSPMTSSYNDLTNAFDDLCLSREQCGYAAPGTEILYAYHHMSYSLYEVSLVQLIECRVREGFRLVQQPPAASSEDYLEFQFALNWRPMFEVHYNVKIRSQDLLIRIQSRVPSPEYVKHRGARSLDGELGEHQDQLDKFVKALKEIDDTLARIANVISSTGTSEAKKWSDEQLERAKPLLGELRPRVLHHWFSVQRFEYVVGDKGASEIHRRLQEWSSAVLMKEQRYWRVLSWAEPGNASHGCGLVLPPDFWCRCCAPKAVPLFRISNRAMLPSNKMDALAPVCDAVSPCCMIEVLEMDNGVLSIMMATLGLCPDAETALLRAVQTQLIGGGTLSMLGFPGLSASGCQGALVGRPGILSSLVEVHGATSPKKANKTRAQAVQRVSVRPHVELQPLGFSNSSASNVDCIECEAMDGLGAVGGSFFTCVPHYKRLVECLPNWQEQWSVPSGPAADNAFKVLQNLRIQEGWHCVRKAESMCCYVKQIPMHSRSDVSLRTPLGNMMTSGNAHAQDTTAQRPHDKETRVETAPKKSIGQCLTLDEIHSSEDGSLKFRLKIGSEPNSPSQSAGARTRSDSAEEEQVVAESSATTPWEASLLQSGALEAKRTGAPLEQGSDAQGIFGTCYYCIHIDLPKQAKGKEHKLNKGARPQGPSVRTSVCLDTPPGTFDLGLLNAKFEGPLCEGVSLPSGRLVQVQGWTPKRGITAVRATVEPLHPQWPTTVELRFIAADGTVVMSLQCPSLEEVEQRCREDVLDVEALEAYSRGGPAVLQELWIERVSESCFSSAPSTASPIPVEELGLQLAKELRSRDRLAVQASNFIDRLHQLAMNGQAGQRVGEHVAERVHTDDKRGMYEELCGLVHSVEARSRLCLEHAFVAADQHDRFLERVSGLVEHRIIHDCESDNKWSRCVKQGRYFFKIHPRRRTPPIASVGDEWKAESKFQFSMLFIPLEVKNKSGKLHCYVGDGHVENMHPPQAQKASIAAVLSQTGYAADAWATDEREDLSHLSRGSCELIERVKQEHGRVQAEAVFNQLRAGCLTLMQAEIFLALNACSKASTTFQLGDLVAASRVQDVGLEAALPVWELLDSSVRKTLTAHGFQLATYVADAFTSRRSWLFFRAEGQPEEQETKEQFVRFVQIEVSGRQALSSDTDELATSGFRTRSCDLPPYIEAPGESELSESPSMSNLFQDAFVAGCAHEAKLVAYYLPKTTGTTWEDDSRAGTAQHLPIGKCHGLHRLRWDGMTKMQAWHQQVAEHIVRLGEDVGAAIGIAHADLLRLVHPTSASTVQTVHRLLERLSDWTIADSKQVSPQLPFQAQFVHSQKVSLPIARPDKMRDAHKEVVSELLAASRAAEAPVAAEVADAQAGEASEPAEVQRRPQSAQLRRLCKVDDAILHKTVLVWLAPDEASVASLPPPFWAFLVVPEEPVIEGREQSILLAQLLILFTPTFCRSCLQDTAEPPAPQTYFSQLQAALRHATIRTNQTLLLEEMFFARTLSELLLPESNGGEDAGCEVALTPLEFIDKLRRLSDERRSSDEDRKPTEKESPTRSASYQEENVAPNLHRGRSDRRKFQFMKNEDDAEQEVGTEQNTKFLQLLKAPDALHTTDDLRCHLQGTARVSIAPCLHRYSILSWLGGGSAEGGKNTSTKVSFQHQSLLAEVVSIFEKNRLQTRSSKAVWLLFIAGSEKEKKGMPFFVRPSYEREADGLMVLKLQFFGLAALETKIAAQLEEKLAAQLEKLAISKLQLHTLDRQQTRALRSDVLDFLRPPGSEPGRSLLLGIPKMRCSVAYAQFVRRALLGLLDPLSEASKELQRSEHSRDSISTTISHNVSTSTLDTTASFVKPPNMRTSMSFLYTRRLTEAKRSDQHGQKRRDKVSEKVLQFQGRIGDGVALVELNFISHATGETLEEFPEEPNAAKLSDDKLNVLHHEVREVSIIRQEGKFRKLEVESADTDGPVSGYLLLDVWHRSLDHEHVLEFKEELGNTVDQALREYNLQLMLRESVRSVNKEQRQQSLKQGYESNVKQSLKELQQGSLEVLEDMPNQHLSSLLAHNPPDIKFASQEADGAALLPPCAYMKCVEGLYELLRSSCWQAGDLSPLLSKDLAETVRKSSPVVTLQCTSIQPHLEAPDAGASPRHRPSDADVEPGPSPRPSGCKSLQHADYFDYLNMEGPFGSLKLQQLFDTNDGSEKDLGKPVTVESLFEQARRTDQDWSPRFVFMWGPPMRAWEEVLSGVPEDTLTSSRSDAGSEFGFVTEIIEKVLPQGVPSRLDQHKVLPGGAAGLQKQKHTLEEWKQSEKFLKDMELASPFLIVTIDGSCARIRGVHIDPMLLLRVQYFLQSQFAWVWARMQMLLHMCSCELQRAHETMLHAKLKHDFPWIFERHASGQQRSMVFLRDDDSAVEKSSALSKSSIDRSSLDIQSYLIFGVPKLVADTLLKNEIVPGVGSDDDLPMTESVTDATQQPLTRTSTISTESSRYRTHSAHSVSICSETGSSSTVPTMPSLMGGIAAQSRLMTAPRWHDQLHRENTPKSNSSTGGQTRVSPGATAPKRGSPGRDKPLLTGVSLHGEVLDGRLASIRSSEAADFQDDVREAQEVQKVLAGQSLVTEAIQEAFGDEGGCVTVLVDPVTRMAELWLEKVDRGMEQDRLKRQIHEVVDTWQQNDVPLAGWAREALAAHDVREDSGSHLLELAAKLRERTTEQSRAALQEPEVFEAETLVLSLIHEHSAHLLEKPFVEPLVTGLGQDVPVPASAVQPAGTGALRNTAAGESSRDPRAEGPSWNFHARTVQLSMKLCEAAPVLTVLQRFLSSLLSAFTRPSPAGLDSAVVTGWTLVLCMEHPLPWHTWDIIGEGHINGVLMRPQTLLLHRKLVNEKGETTALLAEISCRANKLVQIEIFGQHGCSEVARKAAKEVVAAVADFCFDFRLRSAIDSYDSYRPASHGYVWKRIEDLLHNDMRSLVPHPDRARNLFVNGDVPSRKLGAWLQQSASAKNPGLSGSSLGLRAQHLVGFMHAMANRYGFDCAGEAHKPLLALSALDQHFVRVVRAHAAQADFCAAEAMPSLLAPESAPTAQGLRCVLFACPVYTDLSRTSNESITGELGFKYVAILVDFAWCMPTCMSESSAGIQEKWKRLAETLRTSAEEALVAFAELLIAKLVSMRRFQALWRVPQRAKVTELQEALDACCTRVDLSKLSMSADSMSALRSLPSMSRTTLGSYLRSAFPGRFCDVSGTIRIRRHFSGAGGDEELQRELPAKHLFICTSVGNSQSVPNVEERHYVLLHLIWGEENEALQTIWVHSSHRVTTIGSGPPRESTGPSTTRSAAAGPGLTNYQDELADVHMGALPESSGSAVNDSSKSGVAEVCAVNLMVRRFLVLLVQFALKGYMNMEEL